MMQENFTHEVSDGPFPHRRVRISGPLYGDDNVPLLRVEYEDGDTELLPSAAIRQFRPLAVQALQHSDSFVRRGRSARTRRR